jgi:hypothetical protein
MDGTRRLGTFPFGQPLLPRRASADGQRGVFVLGAYPSALHIRWIVPGGEQSRVLAVDNEPEPFWTGQDQQQRIAAWMKAVEWREEFGQCLPADQLNGSSGVAVATRFLEPLGLTRDETLLTDCLDTYHLSDGMTAVIRDVYDPFAKELRLPSADLPQHPSERVIVRLAQIDRLEQELLTAKPETLITLGNAACAVAARLLGREGPVSLSADENYGAGIDVEVGDRRVTWYPLVHPGQRFETWMQVHNDWIIRARGVGPVFEKSLDPEKGKEVAPRLRVLGVQGILIDAAEEGYITELACQMPECLCPEELGGRDYFENVTSDLPDWMPTHEHFPVSREEGGHRTVENAVLAHRLCNRVDYSKRVGRSYGKDLERVEKARRAARRGRDT